MPPCICTHSSAALTATGEQSACASDAATARSGSSSARQSAAYRATARAWVTSTHSVGEPVLERLERADRPAELVARLHVLDGRLQAPLGDAELLGGEQGRAGRQRRRASRGRGGVAGDLPAGRAVERHVGQRPGQVELTGGRRDPSASAASTAYSPPPAARAARRRRARRRRW